jgi:hypothetical protein
MLQMFPEPPEASFETPLTRLLRMRAVEVTAPKGLRERAAESITAAEQESVP